MKLFHGDALDELAWLGDCSIDALVTDPPAGISFMGKAWDKDKGGRDHWIPEMSAIFRECLRIMKPGAHGLVWALPRTSHWTATALEDAGFEVRDVVTHLFGTGFPKSLNVGKAIDKAAGEKRDTVRVKASNPKAIGGGIDGMKGATRPYIERALQGDGFHETAGPVPVTDAAKRWEGFGTALKPAAEMWILVRKPLGGTVAACVLENGTGALNIDGCRIGMSQEDRDAARVPQRNNLRMFIGEGEGRSEQKFDPHVQGRWPANVTLSHSPDCVEECASGCPVAELNRQSAAGGMHGAGASREGKREAGKTGMFGLDGDGHRFGDSGGASRFFYVSKPSKKERGEGNDHPTVKGIALMRWLVRLITPPGGTVLDPFMGSGTTGLACLEEGFDFVGVEQDEHYHEIASRRLADADFLK